MSSFYFFCSTNEPLHCRPICLFIGLHEYYCWWRAVVFLDVKVDLLSLCMIFEIKSIINTNLVAKTRSILRVYEATFIKEKYE